MTWFVVNDVIAATLRYTYPPHNQQIQTLALLTISTGIGYASSTDRPLLFGDENLVSLGHRTIDFSSEALNATVEAKVTWLRIFLEKQ